MCPLTIQSHIWEYNLMAYLTKKKIKGITYYYAEESERVDGKPKRKWQKYLGSLTKIIAAVDGQRESPTHAEIFQLGGVAAYWNIVQKFNMLSIFENNFPKRDQGLSIGFYLVLAAINRGLDPVSKRAMWNWFQSTILLRVFPEVDKASLSSQRFWDNMSLIKENKINASWMAIVNHVLDRENIDLSSASFDGTNFYSFIGSFNIRCSIAKRGKNKQGRRDLRQINYALFCTRKDHFPLYFDVFEGNRHDSKEFKIVIDKFFKEFDKRKPNKEGMTIVFDKGNNSHDNINKFTDDSGFHFVGSVKVDDHKDLSLISNQDKRFKACDNPKLEEVKAFRVTKKIYGKELTVVVTFNNNLYTSQIQSINNEINKCIDKLSVLVEKLADRKAGRIKKGKAPTVESLKKQVARILTGQYMKELIGIKIESESKLPTLECWVNTTRLAELADTYLGKNILITDNHHWSNDDIILTYRSQCVIENAFKEMKDRKNGSWWPMHHWTDQKIKVHGLYCSLTLLIRALIMKTVKEAGLEMPMNKLHRELSGIREVINVFSTGRKKESKQSVVSKMNIIQKKFFDTFEMEKYISS